MNSPKFNLRKGSGKHESFKPQFRRTESWRRPQVCSRQKHTKQPASVSVNGRVRFLRHPVIFFGTKVCSSCSCFVEENLLPILRRAQPATFSSLTILGPKLLVACMRSVMPNTHKKTPKTNHANAPVTCRVLCAISYLQSMQQQRLDEKLILTLSLSVCLSLCLYLSVLLCLPLVYFSFCLHLCCLNTS